MLTDTPTGYIMIADTPRGYEEEALYDTGIYRNEK